MRLIYAHFNLADLCILWLNFSLLYRLFVLNEHRTCVAATVPTKVELHRSVAINLINTDQLYVVVELCNGWEHSWCIPVQYFLFKTSQSVKADRQLILKYAPEDTFGEIAHT